MKKIPFARDYIQVLAYSRTGHLLAVSGHSATKTGTRFYLQVWDTRIWRPVRSLENSTRDLTEQAYLGRFSDDEKVLTTVNYIGITTWNLRNSRRLKTISLGFAATSEGGISGQISKSGALLLLATDSRIALMKMSDEKILHQFKRTSDNDFLAFSPDEKLVLDSDHKSLLWVWETRTGKTLWTLNRSDRTPVWSDDSRAIRFFNIFIWKAVAVRDARTGKLLTSSTR